MPLSRDALLRLYRYMRLTRAIEDRTRALYHAGSIVGGVYTGTGIEATSVGAASALQPGDVLVPLQRDLGAHLVRGITPREVFAQWLARGTAATLGRVGGLHLGDMRVRMIVPTTGVVGASLPVAAGTALAAKLRGEGRVTLAFAGDGATSTGDFHEALTLAASAWVPLVCVVENNGYAYSTPTVVQTRVASLAQKAAAYGIAGASVDGNDVLAVYQAVHEAVERARGGGGPTLVEAVTFRISGHSEADPATYVPESLLAQWAARDPVVRYAAYLHEAGLFSQAEMTEMEAEIEAEVDDALAQAEAAPPADPENELAHLFADDGSGRTKPHRAPETPASATLPSDRVPEQVWSSFQNEDGTVREVVERRWQP